MQYTVPITDTPLDSIEFEIERYRRRRDRQVKYWGWRPPQRTVQENNPDD